VSSIAEAFVERTAPPIRLSQAGKLIRLARAEARVRDQMERDQKSGNAAPSDNPPPEKKATDPSDKQPDLFSRDIPADPERQVDAILSAGEGEMPIPVSVAWDILAARQGDIKSDLVQHGQANGPREPARPA
jgi:hypothetical protein